MKGYIYQVGFSSAHLTGNFFQSLQCIHTRFPNINEVGNISSKENKLFLFIYHPNRRYELEKLWKLKECNKHIPVIMAGETADEFILHWVIKRRIWSFFVLPDELHELSESIKQLFRILKTQKKTNHRETLFPLSKSLNTSCHNSPTQLRTQPAIEYIEKHYTERITVEDLAHTNNMSISSFSRKFKDDTGTNITDYINTYRLSIAESLLTQNDLSINEITYLSGFSDPSYFIKLFKRKMGKTPLEFKGADRCKE